MRWICLALFAGAASLVAFTAQATTLTFKSGATFKGDVVEVKGTNSVVVRSDKDGKLCTIMLSHLTDEDRFLVTGQFPPVTLVDDGTAARAARQRVEEAKILPEQPEDPASASGQIVGAFGLKLGQRFDPKYAVSTNTFRDSFTTKGEPVYVDMTSYCFKPRNSLPHFTSYDVEVTPRSNFVYSISAMTSALNSLTSPSPFGEERDKLLAVLQQKYGKAVAKLSGDCIWHTIKQDTREVTLTFSHSTNSIPCLSIRYTDTALSRQARSEQAEIDAADPARQLERLKLKQQL